MPVSPTSPLSRRPTTRDLRHYYEVLARPARVAVDFVVQPEPHGTADAVLAAERWAEDEPFLVVNGDNLYPPGRAVGAGVRSPSRGSPGSTPIDLVRTGNIPADRVRAFALIEQDDQGCLTRIVEKPSTEEVERLGAAARVSMNCWRFDSRIFDACRAVTPSARGELELPAAVGLAVEAWGTLQGGARRWSRARSVTTRRRARRRTPLIRNDAATMTGERLAAELTRHGLDAIEETRKRSLWDLGAAALLARGWRRPGIGVVGARADRSVRQAHRLRRRPLTGRPGPARVRLRGTTPGRPDRVDDRCGARRAVQHRRLGPSRRSAQPGGAATRRPRCAGCSATSRAG